MADLKLDKHTINFTITDQKFDPNFGWPRRLHLQLYEYRLCPFGHHFILFYPDRGIRSSRATNHPTDFRICVNLISTSPRLLHAISGIGVGRHAGSSMSNLHLVGWGSASDGQLGETSSDIRIPSLLSSFPSPIIDFFPGLWSTLLISQDGVFTTQTRDGVSLPPSKLTLTSAVRSAITAAGIGRYFTLLLSSNGFLFSFGVGAFGELGLGDQSSVSIPTRIEALVHLKIIDVAAAEFHWLALDATGAVFSCGNNASGQLGLSHSESVNTPTRISALWPHPIIAISTGDSHSAALSADGLLFCFGSNKYGQLGNASFQIRVASLSPALVPVPFSGPGMSSNSTEAMDLSSDTSPSTQDKSTTDPKTTPRHYFFIDIACGSAHTVAIRNDGVLLSWGKGENGQLGTSPTRALYEPSFVDTNERFFAVSAGERHSAGLTLDGCAFTWGDGSAGQLGNGQTTDEYCPVQIHPPQLTTSRNQRFTRIKCGGYHTLALVGDEDVPIFNAANINLRKIQICNIENMVQPKAGLSRFGSASILLRTFVLSGEHHSSPTKVDYIAAETAHVKFCRMFGHEGMVILRVAAARIRHQAQVAFGLVQGRHRERLAFGEEEFRDSPFVTPKNFFGKDDSLFRASVANSRECGYLFFIALMNPIYGEAECIPELAELAALLLRCEESGREAFLESVSHCEETVLINRLINPLQNILSDELKAYRRITRNAIFATKVLALCYHGVWRASKRKKIRGLYISRKVFYNETVSEMVDWAQDYDRWVSSKEKGQPSNLCDERLTADSAELPELPGSDDGPFAFCTYSFLLNEEAKFKILRIESQKTMSEESMRSILSLGTSQSFGRLQTRLHFPIEHLAQVQFLVLYVRRNNIVSDTYEQIAHYAHNQVRELHRPLKVMFHGEEGVDEGGVSKDFYQVLIEHILSPDYGMFEYDEETRFHWFRKEFLEPESSWQLIGLIFGLAAFNSILLDVQFPPVVYRKLAVAVRNAQLESQMSGEFRYKADLDDVIETFPSIGKSLQQLSDYDGDDVEDVFGLTFEISYPGLFGKFETAELIEDGARTPVTNVNRTMFVERYIDFLINSSIEKAFRQFATGFVFMLNGPYMNKLTADDLETLVVGEKELDFSGLRHAAQYEGGYHENSPIIVHLWQILDEYDEQLKRQFLAFVTGTDRAPIGGLGKLKIIIQREGPDNNRLPTSRTCFNVLLLPEYGTRAKLRNRLTTAITSCKGFGLE